MPDPRRANAREISQRPWPGIAGPWCDYCSWAYRGRWPRGRMEVKYLNGMCPKRGHATAGVQGGSDEP